ncbi:hypothetical protein Tco_1052216 [Tanacetum coccineum]
MPPRMTTRSASRQTAAPRGGRTGGQTGRGGGRTGELTGRVSGRSGDQNGQGGDRGIRANRGVDEVPNFSTVIAQQLKDLLPTIIAQVGNHTSDIQGDVRSVDVSNGQNGCSYKEFMACSPNDYDGKGGAIAYTHWIKKMESVKDMSRCGTRDREVAVGMTWEDFKVLMRKEFYPNNEMQKLETEFWRHAMVEAGHAAYTNRFHEHARKNAEKRGNVRDDHKRSRTRRAFASTTNPVKREYTGAAPKCSNCSFHRHLEMPCRTCTNYNRLRHFTKDCRARPKMVTLVNARHPTTAREACFECGGIDQYKAACPMLNRAPRQGGNHQNQAMAIKGGQGCGNNSNQAHGGVFMMGAEEACWDIQDRRSKYC